MDELLKYATLITLAGAAISFVIGLIKWIDQRNREQEQKEHEAFHKMVCLASGRSQDGRNVSMVQQVAAVYQLQVYKKYAFASVPILDLMKCEFQKSIEKEPEIRAPHMFEAIDKTLASLSKFKENGYV